ncbi:MAG: hypothetical protein LBF59_04110, partial [Prevotellaceae bacterium]|nr:hypothetical protein [Prevotellaceae bacterium]
MPLVIDVLANDIFDPDCRATAEVSVLVPPENGTYFAVNENNEIEYTGSRSGLDSLTYVVTCGGVEESEAKVYITVNASGSAFVDDVWYYGKNSQGLRFVNNGGSYTARDASGESKVQSHENSLVVSSPYCDGQVIFYSSHDQLYNNLHDSMPNGAFMGNQSVADGLAACYMGENRYLLFSVTNSYEGGRRGLKAYTVDMNEDHGRGDITDSTEIESASAHMSESIELLATNELHKYWLIYAYYDDDEAHHKLHVREVDVTAPNPLIGAVIHSAETSTSPNCHTYTLKASPQHDRIAIANSDDKTVDVFDFNPATGELSNLRTTTHPVDGIAYGVEFSPDGSQLYAAGYTTEGGHKPKLCQYTITPNSLDYVDEFEYWTYTGSAGHGRGGGLKLGPDGRIYVVLAYDVEVGIVDDPNNAVELLSARYTTTMPLDYTPDSYALQFSTGLTRPSIMECNVNIAPTTQDDEATLCVLSLPSLPSLPATVNVLANDTDAEGDVIYLTAAEFLNADDTTLASLTVNAADSTVTLTLLPDATVTDCYTFEIVYHAKDNGLPASQCATGMLRINACPAPDAPLINDVVACYNGSLHTIVKPQLTGNDTLVWYTAETGGTDT